MVDRLQVLALVDIGLQSLCSIELVFTNWFGSECCGPDINSGYDSSVRLDGPFRLEAHWFPSKWIVGVVKHTCVRVNAYIGGIEIELQLVQIKSVTVTEVIVAAAIYCEECKD